MGNVARVKIYGKQYNINGEAPREYMEMLANYLNKKMEEVSEQGDFANPLQVAILAALNISDEFFQIKQSKSGPDTELERRTRELISMLDEGLIGDIFTHSRPSARM
jgi:cell division protein ZapA